MNLDQKTGLMAEAEYMPSPNCDARPPDLSIDVIVVHCISLPPGVFGGTAIQEFFCNQLDFECHPYYQEIAELRVSSHFLIKRDGVLLQFVPVHLRAWHAGLSQFQGRSCVNDFSIGIELEGTDDAGFEERQYEVLSELTRILMQAFPAITLNHLVGHCDIAPGRKADPGPGFDWVRYTKACS
ncbi:MAG: 1,6-anhydro-N-acetylmuramyl-L-alanine amidase AmpD [Gammaproteobacteria bacterium]|nr:1,6-anhydro-N-acetylmuramyl-L-alanine amidase AmpD [Gammaproteobacteria bacterium]